MWALLRAGQVDEALAESAALRDAGDPFAHAIGAAAQEIAALPDPGERRSRIARLPVLTDAEATALMANVAWPLPRAQRFGARD